MSRSWQPADPARLADVLAAHIAHEPGVRRIAIDGACAAAPDDLAAALVTPLNALGRPTAHVRAATFWRDASLRLECGHEDVDSYLNWLDADALRREVLLPVVADGTYLPSLRDPATNRTTHARAETVAPNTVLLVSGSLLMGLGLPFDLTIHLALSPGARARRTPPEEAWTLPALDRYDELADPVQYADVVVRMDDPKHPAISLSTEF